MKTPTRKDFENLGSLITIKGSNTCLGYLLSFDGKGVFEPRFGQVDLNKEEADAHNKALDEASLKGLDECCQVGQYGTFYYNEKANTVTTFMGNTVATASKNGNSITFIRAGKTYRGRTQKDADCFNFKRVS
jgi:hypothetical protein